MSKLVPPHGAKELKPLIFPEAERPDQVKRTQQLKKIPMTSRETSDVIMLAMGAYTPLDGFMGESDWRGCCEDMKLVDGLFWPIPVTLATEPDLADSIEIGEEVALVDADSGEIMGNMTVREKYGIDKELECQNVYGTTDAEHPGAQKVLEQGDVNLGGPVMALSEGEYPEKYPDLFLRPAESRALFTEKGWHQAAAFQTRNPMHRSHEHLAKIAVEVTDGDESLKAGTLTGTGLLLDGHDLHDLVLELGEEQVDDLVLLDGKREEVDLLDRPDLAVLHETSDRGNRNCRGGKAISNSSLGHLCLGSPSPAHLPC